MSTFCPIINSFFYFLLFKLCYSQLTVLRLGESNLQLKLLSHVKVLWDQLQTWGCFASTSACVVLHAISRQSFPHLGTPAGEAADWLLRVDYCCYASSSSSSGPTETLCSVLRGWTTAARELLVRLGVSLKRGKKKKLSRRGVFLFFLMRRAAA